MSGKCYPGEFKIEAVKQVVEYGHSVSGVVTRLGMTTRSLYARIKAYDCTPTPIKSSQILRLRSGVSRKR